MIIKKISVFFLVFLFALTFVYGSIESQASNQETEVSKLMPKYRAFLAETRRIMTDREKEVFMKLETDHDRDIFIQAFWQQRGGRQRGVRANINLLRIMRMVQILDLSEDQVALLFPAMNQNEKEKHQLQSDIQNHMRELRLLLREENPDEQELSELLIKINEIKESLRVKEIEFEKFLEDNLTLVQQARYIVFSQEFYRGLQEELSRARSLQQQMRRKKR